MFNLIRVVRNYAGLNQEDFSRNAGLTQPDLCELETSEKPYGIMEKYLKLSRYTGIPVDAILRNDFRQIPEEFFHRFPCAQYTPVPTDYEHQVGRGGEELILAREQARLADAFPNLSRLVIPYFKLGVKSPGYDVLSFDDEGHPFALEVKTSAMNTNAFRLTNLEHRTAKRLTEAGERYQVALITQYGTPRETVEDFTWTELQQNFDISGTSYRYQRKPEVQAISGLAYHRRRLGLQQTELAQRLGIKQCNLSSTENGTRGLIAAQYLKASDILGVPVDDLLRTYSTAELEVEDGTA